MDIRDEAGATAVEYGMVAGAVGIVFIIAGPELLNAMGALLGTVVDVILGGTP